MTFGGGHLLIPFPAIQFPGFFRTPTYRQAVVPVAAPHLVAAAPVAAAPVAPVAAMPVIPQPAYAVQPVQPVMAQPVMAQPTMAPAPAYYAAPAEPPVNQVQPAIDREAVLKALRALQADEPRCQDAEAARAQVERLERQIEALENYLRTVPDPRQPSPRPPQRPAPAPNHGSSIPMPYPANVAAFPPGANVQAGYSSPYMAAGSGAAPGSVAGAAGSLAFPPPPSATGSAVQQSAYVDTSRTAPPNFAPAAAPPPIQPPSAGSGRLPPWQTHPTDAARFDPAWQAR